MTIQGHWSFQKKLERDAMKEAPHVHTPPFFSRHSILLASVKEHLVALVMAVPKKSLIVPFSHCSAAWSQ